MKSTRGIRAKYVEPILSAIAVIVVLLALIPIHDSIAIERTIQHYVGGQVQAQGTLVIEGKTTRRLLGNRVTFEGDISIRELHDGDLEQVKLKLDLKRNAVVIAPLVRPGVQVSEGERVAITESIGYGLIKGIFDEVVLSGYDKASSEIEISGEDFWAEGYELGIEYLRAIQQLQAATHRPCPSD